MRAVTAAAKRAVMLCFFDIASINPHVYWQLHSLHANHSPIYHSKVLHGEGNGSPETPEFT
jgi:hypothetical protein